MSNIRLDAPRAVNDPQDKGDLGITGHSGLESRTVNGKDTESSSHCCQYLRETLHNSDRRLHAIRAASFSADDKLPLCKANSDAAPSGPAVPNTQPAADHLYGNKARLPNSAHRPRSPHGAKRTQYHCIASAIQTHPRAQFANSLARSEVPPVLLAPCPPRTLTNPNSHCSEKQSFEAAGCGGVVLQPYRKMALPFLELIDFQDNSVSIKRQVSAMDDPAHFYSPLRSADALLPRSGSINWAERRHHAASASTHRARIGLLIFWTIIAALLFARIALVDTRASQADAATARSVPTSQLAAPAPAGM